MMKYDVHGEGIPFLLFPGLGCDARMWGPLLDSLPLEVKAIVPRIWEAESMAEGAKGVVELMEELGEPNYYAAGLSMGGYMLFEVLRLCPEKIKRAVFLDTTAYPDDGHRREKREQVLRLIAQERFEEVLGPFIDSVVWADGHNAEPVADLILSMSRYLGPQSYARSMASIRDRGSYEDVLGSCEVPMLFISGEHDKLSPPELAACMAGEARSGAAVEIPDASHMSAVENPVAVASAIEIFFRASMGLG